MSNSQTAVMTLAIQNSVQRSDMGTATSSATFFRSLGSSFGGAIFGSILIGRVAHYLMQTAIGGSTSQINISAVEQGSGIHNLPPDVTARALQAFVHSFHDMFLLTIPVALLSFLVALYLRETPLRSSHEEPTLDSLEL